MSFADTERKCCKAINAPAGDCGVEIVVSSVHDASSVSEMDALSSVKLISNVPGLRLRLLDVRFVSRWEVEMVFCMLAN